jgi:hypothetical protein
MPDNSEYYAYSLALIYHPDNQVPAADPIVLGETGFIHLIGSGPGLSLAPSDATMVATDLAQEPADITLEPATAEAATQAP